MSIVGKVAVSLLVLDDNPGSLLMFAQYSDTFRGMMSLTLYG
jgi:hypothetical protein